MHPHHQTVTWRKVPAALSLAKFARGLVCLGSMWPFWAGRGPQTTERALTMEVCPTDQNSALSCPVLSWPACMDRIWGRFQKVDFGADLTGGGLLANLSHHPPTPCRGTAQSKFLQLAMKGKVPVSHTVESHCLRVLLTTKPVNQPLIFFVGLVPEGGLSAALEAPSPPSPPPPPQPL